MLYGLRQDDVLIDDLRFNERFHLTLFTFFLRYSTYIRGPQYAITIIDRLSLIPNKSNRPELDPLLFFSVSNQISGTWPQETICDKKTYFLSVQLRYIITRPTGQSTGYRMHLPPNRIEPFSEVSTVVS